MMTNLLIHIHHYCRHYMGLSKKSLVMILLHFINSLFISICYFLPLYFVTQLSFDIRTASYIIAFYGLGTVAGGVIGGGTSDKVSPHFVAILSLIMQAFAFLLLPILHSPDSLMLILFLLGISTYSFMTANFLWALSFCHDNESQKIKTINILDTVSNLGLGFAAIFISLIHFSALPKLATFAAISLFFMAGILFFKSPNICSIKIEPVTKSKHTRLSPKQAHSLSMLILILFFIGLIISQLSSTYSIHLDNLFPRYHFGGFGLMFALNTFLIVLLQTPLANYCQSYHRFSVIGIGGFLLGLGMFILSLTQSYFFIVIACVIYTFGEILFFSVAQLICYENAPVDKRGWILGIYRMVYAASRIIGPVTGSYIYQQLGSAFLWNSCGAIGAFCLLSAIYTRRLTKQVT